MKKRVKFFVSYASRNKVLANQFLENLYELLKPSKRYDYALWKDNAILLGGDWDKQIISARDDCDFGLLLISPSFLGSKYITEEELPIFVSGKKPSIPVMIRRVDLSRHDLKGLEKRQIFRLASPGFTEPKAYSECKPNRRENFVHELFGKIEDRLNEYYEWKR